MLVNPAETRRLARTEQIPDPGPLVRFISGPADCAFLSDSLELVGLGELARFETDSLDAADIWWHEFCTDLEHETEMPGVSSMGPVAFGSFAFDPDSSADRSVFIVPRTILGRRDGVAWITQMGVGQLPSDASAPPLPDPPAAPGEVSWSDGALTPHQWEEAVGAAVGRIRAGELDKVVLARDLVAHASDPIEPAWIVRRLRKRYPHTFTYLIDRLVGASPELLVERRAGLITSRVLAGTASRVTGDPKEVAELSAALVASHKDRQEHAFAARSVAESLAPYVRAMNVPQAPYVLELPNVLHLATDITASTDDAVTSLALAQVIHPTSAVGGTPRETARLLIAELEDMDRGRYAGPVGWIDASGDGQWALALRGGELSATDPRVMRIFAGCGIIADSVPAEELAEARAKFIPMQDALG